MIGHELSHETCGLEGCTYTANSKQVEIHILHLHSTGLYQKRKQMEDNDARKVAKDPPEDIEKWRQQRKKNFPSVSKTEQAKRQRKLRYIRKLENFEARKQREAQREEVLRKRREEREQFKSNEAQQKRPRRNRKRKQIERPKDLNEGSEEIIANRILTSEIVELDCAKTLGAEMSKEESARLESLNKRDVSNQISVQGDQDKKNLKQKLEHRHLTLPHKPMKHSISHYKFKSDLPFWFGRIEKFKGTQYHNKDRNASESTENSVMVNDAEIELSDDEHVPKNKLVPVPRDENTHFSQEEPQTANQRITSDNINPNATYFDIRDTTSSLELIAVTRANELAPQHYSVPYRSNDNCSSMSKNSEKIKLCDNPSLDINGKIEESDNDEAPEEGPVLRESPDRSLLHNVRDLGAKTNLPNAFHDRERKFSEIPVNSKAKENQQSCNSPEKNGGSPRPIQNLSSKSCKAKSDINPQRRQFKIIKKSFYPPTLLEKLLADNIEKERDELLQCTRFVVEKNFFQK